MAILSLNRCTEPTCLIFGQYYYGAAIGLVLCLQAPVLAYFYGRLTCRVGMRYQLRRCNIILFVFYWTLIILVALMDHHEVGSAWTYAYTLVGLLMMLTMFLATYVAANACSQHHH